MTHGSLFSGIGGFDLAAEWMGWKNVFHCEWNPFGQKVLKHYWPQAESFTDITKTDFTKYANKIDILTGGFPCQPYSSAGKRLGKADERHLWPEMLRAIRELEPTYIVGENVRGLLNWNGGMVFEEVCAELENIGYQVAPCLIPACGVGAPHRRERIWFIAYSDKRTARPSGESRGIESNGGNRHLFQKQRRESAKFDFGLHEFSCDVTNTNGNGFDQCNGQHEVNANKGGEHAQHDVEQICGDVANTKQPRLQRRAITGEIQSAETEMGRKENKFTIKFTPTNNKPTWQEFPTVSPVCDGNDGISDRLDGITFSKWRNESIKAGGNAIVPQVAFQIFQTIQKLHHDLHPMQAHNA